MNRQALADEITSLPGLTSDIAFRHFSGYLQISETKFMFYWCGPTCTHRKPAAAGPKLCVKGLIVAVLAWGWSVLLLQVCGGGGLALDGAPRALDQR